MYSLPIYLDIVDTHTYVYVLYVYIFIYTHGTHTNNTFVYPNNSGSL